MWAFLLSSRKNNYIFVSFVLLIKALEENSLSTMYLLFYFYPWFKFYFPLFLGMVTYDYEYCKQRKIYFKPRIKLNHNISTKWLFHSSLTINLL